MNAAPAAKRAAAPENIATLTGAFEASGSPRWVMDAIKRHRLDIKHGFRLEFDLLGDRVRRDLQSTEAALADERVDFIETDWISIARCRAHGLRVSAVFPYGAILGALVAARDGGITGLQGLRGRRVGVVRLVDKNWAVLRAACVSRCGFDPQAHAQVREAGSKTALLGQLRSGEVEAAVLYWHLVPPLLAAEPYREVVDLLGLLPELGTGVVPTTFFTFKEELIERRPELIRGFRAAFSEAVASMRRNEAVWRSTVGGILRTNDARCLGALRDKWSSRMCATWNRGVLADLHRLFERIKDQCGCAAVGLERLPAETFNCDFMS